MNFIIRTLITAAVAYGLTYILTGVHFAGFQAAIVFSLFLALLNAVVKPILQFFSLPITIITFGLFLLVINALVILIADHFMDSVKIDGFWWALIFSIALSLCSSVLQGIFISKDK